VRVCNDRILEKNSKKTIYTRRILSLEQCPDVPKRGKETMLIFHTKPLNYGPCQKCAQLDEKKKAQRVQASKTHQ